VTRVSFLTRFENSKRILLDNTAELNETRQEIASGKKLRVPSDNPSDTVRLLQFQNLEDNVEQFKSNINQGRNFLENSESTLQSVNSLLQRTRELAVRGANDSLNEEARSNIAGCGFAAPTSAAETAASK